HTRFSRDWSSDVCSSDLYPPGTLIEFFQRMGMSFGGDTNAFTSFDRTQYMIELANTQESTLAEGLKVFSDYAGGLLLSDKEIQRSEERRVGEGRDSRTVS